MTETTIDTANEPQGILVDKVNNIKQRMLNGEFAAVNTTPLKGQYGYTQPLTKEIENFLFANKEALSINPQFPMSVINTYSHFIEAANEASHYWQQVARNNSIWEGIYPESVEKVKFAKTNAESARNLALELNCLCTQHIASYNQYSHNRPQNTSNEIPNGALDLSNHERWLQFKNIMIDFFDFLNEI